jgi:transmembrane sensor
MTGTDDRAGRIEQEATDWFARLRAGDTADQLRFEDWYAGDIAHADAYDRVLRTWETTGRAGETPAGQARADERVARPVSKRRYVIAAIAALVVACFIGLGLAAHGPGMPGASAAYAYRTVPGQIRSVRLVDGSQVTLDTDSAMSAAFSSSERRVRLMRGRARFDVSEDTKRPFVVDTECGQVVAIGSVDVAIDQRRMTVVLWRGDADVRELSGKRTTAKLAIGQSLRIDSSATDMIPQSVGAPDPRWVSGMLSFEDAPVADVITAANRYTRTPIVLADPAIGSERFTGTFAATDTRSLARMIAAMFELSLMNDREGKFVLRRRNRQGPDHLK